jgi:hypothetical protein
MTPLATPCSARSWTRVFSCGSTTCTCESPNLCGLAPDSPVEELQIEDCSDPKRLLQVFENLIGNAIKFTPPGGRIVVRAASKGEGVMFSVADTGAGIAPDAVGTYLTGSGRRRREPSDVDGDCRQLGTTRRGRGGGGAGAGRHRGQQPHHGDVDTRTGAS